jgi:chromosome segregation ATPase
MAEYEKNINELKEGNSILSSTIENWTGRVGDMGTLLEKNEEKIMKKEFHIQSLKNELKSSNALVSDLREENNMLLSNTQELKNTLCQTKKDVHVKNSEVDYAKEKQTYYDKTKEEYIAKIKQLESKVSELYDQNSTEALVSSKVPHL